MICISCHQKIKEGNYIGVPTENNTVLCKRCDDMYWFMVKKDA